MEYAIQPDAPSLPFGKIAEDQKKLHQIIDPDDEKWSMLGEHPMYPLLKGYIQKLIDGLDDLEGKAFEAGASLQEIGLRRAVNRLTKANLQSIITKIEKTTDIVNENRKRVTGGNKG